MAVREGASILAGGPASSNGPKSVRAGLTLVNAEFSWLETARTASCSRAFARGVAKDLLRKYMGLCAMANQCPPVIAGTSGFDGIALS